MAVTECLLLLYFISSTLYMYKNQLVKTVCTKMSLKGEEEFIPKSIAEGIFNNVTLFLF